MPIIYSRHPCPRLTGVAGSCLDRLSIPEHSGHEAPLADDDLEALSLKELKQWQKEIGKAIFTQEERRRSEARAKAEVFARDLSYSLAELTGSEVKAIRTSAEAKYRHPENQALTWSGRGRRPQWFVDALQSGKSATQLTVG